ncbi:MAG: hydrolase 1, exosortase A system-associated, partial [Alphaproteobacteria bacterium]|nr:hydrolase 1, exosortase A system-associated [Alphaproteobacteria bacterium]
MRRILSFDCAGNRCWATLDDAAGTTGLLIVSGGNEVRAGTHRGMAQIAADLAHKGCPVFRFDRRGVGDSEGVNGGFESSAQDIAAALAAFSAAQPQLSRIIAFGNCDAATALLLHVPPGIDALILTNPWVVEPPADQPAPAAARAYYAARLRNPRAWWKLITGKVDLDKTRASLASAVAAEAPSALAARVAAAMATVTIPIYIHLAAQDGTAIAFDAQWQGAQFDATRTHVQIIGHDTASHS